MAALKPWLVAGGALAMLACGPSPASEPPRIVAAPVAAPAVVAEVAPAGAALPPNPLVERTLATMSRLRGLASTRPVPSVTLGRKALVLQVKAHVEHEVPVAAIRNEGIVQKLLGFFPVADDYEAVTYGLLEGQLAGYYEPANATMYLAADLDEENARETLSHELVHALQDQHWDLAKRSAYVAGQDDADSAFSALAEGDATSAMIDEAHAHEHSGTTALEDSEASLEAALASGVDEGPGAKAPHALRMALVAPYVDGLKFVNALRRAGGWALVDRAWDRPPETMEQVLHVDKWRSHEPALNVAPPPPPSSEGFTRKDENTYGEQGLRLAFAEWMALPLATIAATGWGGDRAALYGQGDQAYAFAWHVRFDDATFAARAFASLERALGAIGRRGPGGSECVERAGNGVFAIRRAGADVALAIGTVHADGARWTAALGCSETAAWLERTLRPEPTP